MSIEGSYENINLLKTDEVTGLAESRGILDDDIRMVIHHAEDSGEKLYDPQTDEFLAKRRIAETNFFVHYSAAAGGAFQVHSAFCIRADFEEE